jgi:two-component system OmpR family response regulator
MGRRKWVRAEELYMERTPHCLIVEDDREISDLVGRFLTKHNFRVSVAANGRAMDRVIAESRIDIIILDIMLPGADGLSLCRRLRAESTIPIIMLTALGDEMDRILGLEMGADDYIAKPFNSRELLARVRAVLRRVATLPESPLAAKSNSLTFDGWRVDLAKRQLHSPDGARIVLTSGEFDLLVALCQHPHRVLTRDQLLDLTLGRSAKAFDRSVDIRISRLRRKIEFDPKQPKFITTVRSGGYFFAAQVTVT